MPTWNQLVEKFAAQPPEQQAEWIGTELANGVERVAQERGGRNVIVYGSAFLQKPQVPGHWLSITHEDINGLMASIQGIDCSAGLSLVLHTPGGVTNATEAIVAYLRSKFDDIEVIVPVYAMSAGTMISLAADRVVMGRQSQLGPIDPQLTMGGRSVSAGAIVETFNRAKTEILEDQAAAHVWATILPTMGPSLLLEAQNALDYGERMVADWLETYMFAGRDGAGDMASATAHHFNDATADKSHGRRIDRDEARANNVEVEDLEESQQLQEAVLTLYHLLTIMFEQTPAVKIVESSNGNRWLKNYQA